MKQVIFVHIPRTAGLSIERYAKKRYTYKAFKHGSCAENNVQFLSTSHASVPFLLKEKMLDQQMWDDAFKFAIVRNSWDRLVSIYEFYCSFRIRRKCKTNYCLNSFEEFVKATIVLKKHVPVITVSSYRPLFQHVLPQLFWLQKGVDFIGRFENLDEDWKTICKLSSMKYEKLTKMNTIKRKSYQEYYSERIRDIVSSFYVEEIERFGFKF